jgi:hypothetical protein
MLTAEAWSQLIQLVGSSDRERDAGQVGIGEGAPRQVVVVEDALAGVAAPAGEAWEW